MKVPKDARIWRRISGTQNFNSVSRLLCHFATEQWHFQALGLLRTSGGGLALWSMGMAARPLPTVREGPNLQRRGGG